MRQVFFLIIFFAFNLPNVFTQVEILKPILVDKSILSGVGLKKIDIKSEPEKDIYQKRLYRGQDISLYVVSSETWNNEIEEYAFDEYVYLLHGQAIVKPKKANSKVFHSGDHLFVPKGFKGEWEIRSGSNLHYELSVITTTRADSTLVSNDLNFKDFNRSVFSGSQIEFDSNSKYQELLHKGLELTIKFKAEKPTSEIIEEPMKEKLIHLLSGQILFTDGENEKHIFYTGDFFIVPQGLVGTWESDGHGLIKYLTIEKTAEKK